MGLQWWSSGNGAEEMPETRDKLRRRFVSAQDVAERAGVSRSAVSRAFTPGASIAPATRAKVLKAADALGYEVNDLARAIHRLEGTHAKSHVRLVASRRTIALVKRAQQTD